MVDVKAFSGHFALNTITFCGQELRVTMSLCHVRTRLYSGEHMGSPPAISQDAQEPDRDADEAEMEDDNDA